MILVTGATGLVGRAVMATAVRRGLEVRGAVRRTPESVVEGAEYVFGATSLPIAVGSLLWPPWTPSCVRLHACMS